jgi:hypothetical protein
MKIFNSLEAVRSFLASLQETCDAYTTFLLLNSKVRDFSNWSIYYTINYSYMRNKLYRIYRNVVLQQIIIIFTQVVCASVTALIYLVSLQGKFPLLRSNYKRFTNLWQSFGVHVKDNATEIICGSDILEIFVNTTECLAESCYVLWESEPHILTPQ